jgi:putative beta-lysine N-acetyltransferase
MSSAAGRKRNGDTGPDLVEEWGGALVQHGQGNGRVYLMRLGGEEPLTLIRRIGELCRRQGYGKAFAKVPASRSAAFIAEGWRTEAYVPGFFRGEEDAFFLCAYFDETRRDCGGEREYLEELDGMLGELGCREPNPLPSGMSVAACGPADVEAMAELYKKVFPRYPFPIHDPAYLRQTMESHVDYFGIWSGNRLVALSSAEKDAEELNAEMTDFAVDPEYRGLGLALRLLKEMELDLSRQGMRTFFTIARLRSPGMNATFLKAGYRYSGTLFNNTLISEGLESMNVYYKHTEEC